MSTQGFLCVNDCRSDSSKNPRVAPDDFLRYRNAFTAAIVSDAPAVITSLRDEVYRPLSRTGMKFPPTPNGNDKTAELLWKWAKQWRLCDPDKALRYPNSSYASYASYPGCWIYTLAYDKLSYWDTSRNLNDLDMPLAVELPSMVSVDRDVMRFEAITNRKVVFFSADLYFNVPLCPPKPIQRSSQPRRKPDATDEQYHQHVAQYCHEQAVFHEELADFIGRKDEERMVEFLKYVKAQKTHDDALLKRRFTWLVLYQIKAMSYGAIAKEKKEIVVDLQLVKQGIEAAGRGLMGPLWEAWRRDDLPRGRPRKSANAG